MTPSSLEEFLTKRKGVQIADAALEVLCDAVHFDAGDITNIPWSGCFLEDVRPPFDTTTVQAVDQQGRSFLVGCWVDPLDGRWNCFEASRVHGGIGLGFFVFCPKTFQISIPNLHPRTPDDVARFGSSFLNNFFAVIACSNVRMVDVPAPEALNKKRARAGKPPIKSHKVLHIVAPSSYSKAAPQGGTHASPRVHLRRGHIRKNPSGTTTWVQQCVVGSKHGIVTKDYRVSYAGAAA